jgi:hypothetical protein
MKRLLLIMMALALSFICRAETDDENVYNILGRRGEVRVIGPEMKMAVNVCDHVQEVKRSLKKRFGVELTWTDPLVIQLEKNSRKRDGKEIEFWVVRMWKSGRVIELNDVYRTRIHQKITETTAKIYTEDIADHDPSPGSEDIPRWIYIGAAQNVGIENRRVFRQYIDTKIRSGEVLTLDDFLQINTPFPELKIEELYKKQSGSIFGFLTNQKGGRAKLVQALKSAAGGEMNITVLEAFGYDSAAVMEQEWKQSALALDKKILHEDKLTMTETGQKLKNILRVEIVVVDQETLEEKRSVTDFIGLARYKHGYRRNVIGLDKLKQLNRLLLESKDEYAAVITMYRRSLTAALSSEIRKTIVLFNKAERIRKKLEKKSQFI